MQFMDLAEFEVSFSFFFSRVVLMVWSRFRSMNRSFLNFVFSEHSSSSIAVLSQIFFDVAKLSFSQTFLGPKRLYSEVMEDFVWKQMPKTSLFFSAPRK